MGRPGARRREILSGACAALVLAGCAPDETRLRTEPILRHGLDSPASLHVDRAGVAWVGRPGELAALEAGRPASTRLRLPGPEVPEVLAALDGALQVRAGDRLIRVDTATGTIVAERAGFAASPVLLDVRGRFLAQGAPSGAVLGFDPASLEPVWGWAARGAPTTAVAITPEGDVLWQALAPTGIPGLLLERDVQTGRILDEHPVFGRVLALGAAPSGDLLGVVEDGDRLVGLRLRPRADQLDPVWRLVLRVDGDQDPVVRFAPQRDRMAVYTTGSEARVLLVDAEAGELLGVVEEAALDAAFSPDGDLYLLTPRELRRVVLMRRP